eukprot:4553565-Prorocentrum_lima.AAC.1
MGSSLLRHSGIQARRAAEQRGCRRRRPLAWCSSPRSLLLAHRYRLRSIRTRHRTAAQPGLPRD